MPPPRTPHLSAARDVPLEALRGLAALMVVAWHFLLGLFPEGLVDPAYGLAGSPLFAFVHGTGAVSIFFVLSGFVLTRRYFETGDRRHLALGAIKRWPRLFLPVFISVMISWLLFTFDLYGYEKAGQMSGSQWLASFGFAMNPPFDPDFARALWNGFAEPLYHDNNAFNPLLWTIHIELMGSYIAFAFAALITAFRKETGLVPVAAVMIAFITHFIEPFLVGFLPGVILAWCAPKLAGLKTRTAVLCLALGIVFLGYHDPVGFYGFLDFLALINGEPLRAYTACIGAVLVMIAFIGWEPLRHVLSGRAARWLGRFSFPIYLVHLILIFSLGSAVYVATQGALLTTLAALIPAILALAAAFVVIDAKWVAWVNGRFRKLKI